MALDAALLLKSFNALLPKADQMASAFYGTLFRRFPELKPLFGLTGMEAQRQKLIRALQLTVLNVERPTALYAYLGGLGQIHVAYGVVPANYPAFKKCLLTALAEASDAWDAETEKAWVEALDRVAELMLAGAHFPALSGSIRARARRSMNVRLARTEGE